MQDSHSHHSIITARTCVHTVGNARKHHTFPCDERQHESKGLHMNSTYIPQRFQIGSPSITSHCHLCGSYRRSRPLTAESRAWPGPTRRRCQITAYSATSTPSSYTFTQPLCALLVHLHLHQANRTAHYRQQRTSCSAARHAATWCSVPATAPPRSHLNNCGNRTAACAHMRLQHPHLGLSVTCAQHRGWHSAPRAGVDLGRTLTDDAAPHAERMVSGAPWP